VEHACNTGGAKPVARKLDFFADARKIRARSPAQPAPLVAVLGTAADADLSSRPMSATLIYHVCRRDELEAARTAGSYGGSSQDRADGFIHFSSAAQVVASVAKHRAGQDGLVIVEVDAGALGAVLRWEPSRGGALFPHLYGALPLAAITRAADLPLAAGGHVFPWDLR